MAEHVRVVGAAHQDGLLHIELVREVPEALKPRQIKIASDLPLTAKTVEGKAKKTKTVN